MKTTTSILVASALAAVLAVPVTASAADGPNADCHVRENGENKKKKSGPCTYTETQGNVWILLANGDSWTLKPKKDKKDRYKDHRGKTVKLKMEAGVPVYSWEHRHITVNKRSAVNKQNAADKREAAEKRAAEARKNAEASNN